MSKWPGKYVIGLTGNIATGKSIVRRMLEHLGAYTIDADALAHRAIARGAPGHQPVVDTFGRFILDAAGQIDREKLGRLVFSNPDALKELEAIIHPLVQAAVDVLVRRSSQHVVVIEAIKLLEGKLAPACDSIWVTDAPEQLQQERLVNKRSMNADTALQRIRSQSPQQAKLVQAGVIIHNTGPFDDTWQQVVAAWKQITPLTDTTPVIIRKPGMGVFTVQRGRPRDSARIASFLSRLDTPVRSVTEQEVMARFGDQAYLLLMADQTLVGLAGWQVENLVSRATEFHLDPGLQLAPAMKALVCEVERAALELQCEASLLFLPASLASLNGTWNELGYARREIQDLGIQAWQEAALESQPRNSSLFFKQLRQDRVLRPI